MLTENGSMTRLLVAFTLVAMTAACATEPPPRPTQLDPSSPNAPESAPLTTGSLARPTTPTVPPQTASPTPEKGPDTGAPAKPGATLYTCPMHPEVISDKPGKCPKCGMTLAPKEPESKP
jgi:hypothetical protein